MLKVNKKVEYALMSLKYMAEKSGSQLSTAREICDSLNIPFDPTARALQLLNQENILSSIKGVKGGYKLNKPLSDISFMQLNQIIEKKADHSFCTDKMGKACELSHNCTISSPMQNLGFQVNQFFNQLNLNELLFNHGDQQ